MYKVQIILITEAERQSLGLFEISIMPRKGDFLAVPVSSKQKSGSDQQLVQIREIIYSVYSPGQRPDKSLDAVMLVFPRTPLT